MSNLYNPQLTEVQSSVTPKQAVVDNSALQLFSDVANVAKQATFAYAGQKELGDLGRKFDDIVQLRSQGGNATTLSAKARSLLAEAKATSPYIAKQANELFNTKFGGGSAGVFAKTAQEKAQDAYVQEVTETALQLGLSNEEAAKRIKLNRDAEDAKNIIAQQKETRQYNGELLFSTTQKTLNTKSVSFMDSVARGLEMDGGSLSVDNKRALISTVESERVNLQAQLNADVKDPETGHLLISKDMYQENLEAIDKWAEDSKRIVEDNAYAKLIVESNQAKNAEVNLMATRKYEVFKVLESAGGQELVKTYIQASMRGEGAARELLKQIHPAMADAFDNPSAFSAAADKGFDKLLLGEGKRPLMNQLEAAAVGTALNDPNNAKLTNAVLEQAVSNPEVMKQLKKMLLHNPDASRMAFSEQYKAWAGANKDKAKKVSRGAIEGLRTSFLSEYAGTANSLNVSFKFSTPEEAGVSNAAKAGRGGLAKASKYRIVGENMTPELAGIIMNAKYVLDSNPDLLKEVNGEVGGDLTAEEAVVFLFTEELPERMLAQPEEQEPETGDLDDDE